tara:strand:+ start:1336 stop:2784 length:1449 start_codon:yes stop_codon:yes gene_type:complete
MLASFKKFSSSIYAKILLGIVIIPFVFWGMGSNFTGGNKNIIVVIDKEKYSVQNFINFINRFTAPNEKIDSNRVDEFLSSFITEKLIEKEVELLNIKLSNKSLSQLIKHQKDFKRENKFSRVEYEKFLLKNNITASYFETNFSKFEKRKQVLNFIGGGIYPSQYKINMTYDKINQKRHVELIDLNDIFKKEIKFTENQVQSYFEKNKNKYEETFKSIKFIELTPKKLTNTEEFTDIFFDKIDEIDYMIIEGKNLDDIALKLNLRDIKSITLNEIGEDINFKVVSEIPKNLVKNIFSIDVVSEPALIENEKQFFITELNKTEKIQKTLDNESVRANILRNLKNENKRKFISEIVSKINKKSFVKTDFDKLAIDENITIKKITIENLNDNKTLENDLIKHIYDFPEKNIIAVNDINLSQSYLIYIDKIENVTLKEDAGEYEKYLSLSKGKITNALYNTYDNYIKNKYEIDVNYQTLDIVKNQLN